MKRRKDRRSKGPAPQRIRSAARQIRSWRYPFIVMGIVQIAAVGWRNPSWGIILIVVGLACFYFVDPSMFVVIAVTIGWAGISNLLVGQLGSIVFACLQLAMAVLSFRNFLSHRKAQAKLRYVDPKRWKKLRKKWERSASVFPLAGFVLSCLSLLLLLVMRFLVAVSAWLDLANVVGSLAMGFAVLSLALCLSSLLSGFPRRELAVSGGVASLIVLAVEVVLTLLT